MLGPRFRSRSTWNYMDLGTTVVGTEVHEYPKNVFVKQTDHYLTSDGLSGESEWCYDAVHHKPYSSENGGPFRLSASRRSPGFYGVRINCGYFGNWYEYKGNLYVSPSLSGGITLSEPPHSYGDVSSMGPEAWNRFKPGKPAMQLGVFLAELRDMPRMVKDLKDKCRALRSMRGKSSWKKFISSKDFLSYQMAWKPFVSDVHKMSHEAFTWRNRLARLQKYSGIWRRVSGTLSAGEPVYSGVDKRTSWSAFLPILRTQYQAQPSDVETRLCTFQRVWFVAKMRYYVPPVETPAQQFNAMRRLYGVTLSPDVIWNIMPWSWLADWFGNVGDNISNLSTGAVDDLVAAGAFIMGHTMTESQKVVRAYLRVDGGVQPITLTGRASNEVKHRSVASPFGFGLSAGDLTLRQTAILAALGLKF